jgi:cytoskeletal protein CcmA (bactofilin family)
MSALLEEAIEPNQPEPARESAKDPFDTSLFFDQWLQDVGAEAKNLTHTTAAEPADVLEDEGFYIGSFPGSNCEVSFEGVLHFDGYSFGPINSPEGTLVLTKRGRIEADVNVKVAVIHGWVTGDITASERVVLESEARVTGQIYTRALSVRLGAVFDGECVLTAPESSFGVMEAPREIESNQAEHMALAMSSSAFSGHR